MDSRLIAGAYSQHFRALEKEQLEDCERGDSIAKAKKLSQETNKRRKIQAQKRKLEAQREEKRRQEILSKRREEQNQATEKYQRSHIPPSSRQGSGRLSPRRHQGAALEDALRLIRGSPRHGRPPSDRNHVLSPGDENMDPLEKSYFDQARYHSSRPASGRPGHQMDPGVRAEMMDHSMQNLTSSRSLFEQQLEQQQNLLLEQQQQALLDFNYAVRKEIDRDFSTQENREMHEDLDHLDNSGAGMQLSDSCSSLDSLEGSKRMGDDPDAFLIARGTAKPISPPVKQPSGYSDSRNSKPSHIQQSEIEEQQHFYLSNSNRVDPQHNYATGIGSMELHQPLNQDMTASATFKKDTTAATRHGDSDPAAPLAVSSNSNVHLHNRNESHSSYVGLTRGDLIQDPSNSGRSFAVTGTAISQEKPRVPIKQFSQDSLADSGSSSSSISLIKVPEGGLTNKPKQDVPSNPADHVKDHQVSSISGAAATSNSLAWVSPSPQSNSSTLTETPTPTQNDNNVLSDFNPRYVSAIGLSIWPGNNPVPNDQTSMVSTLLANNQHPYSTRGTLTSVTTTTSYPASSFPQSAPEPIIYSNVGNLGTSDASDMNKISTVSALNSYSQNNSKISNFGNMTTQDMSYPLSHTYQPPGISSNQMTYPSQPQASTMLSSAQQPGSIVSPQQGLADMTKLPLSNVQSYQQIPSSSHLRAASASHVPTIPHQDGSEAAHAHASQAGQAVSGPIPVPAVRTVFPKTRPPVPSSVTSAGGNVTTAAYTHWEVNNCAANSKQGSAQATPDLSSKGAQREDKAKEDMDCEGVEAEDAPPLRGILKQAAPKVIGQTAGKANQNKSFPRDSLELARLNSDKKGKKKSVRFADHQIEEEDSKTMNNESNGSKGMVIINTGAPLYKPAITRPVSAKTSSVTQKPDSVQRAPRAASAGSVRGTPAQNPTATPSSDHSNNNAFSSAANNSRSNLPPSQGNSLNTSIPINRPKAAAHIIMSPEHHTGSYKTSSAMSDHSPQSPTSGAAASIAHKSHLETKVKTVNNNFMTKVPVKVPSGGQTNGVVYHAARAPSQTNDGAGGDSSAKDYNQQQQALSDRAKISASKRVPVSNVGVSRTSKIAIQQSSNSTPTYANTNNDNANVPVYDENGLRIDRTPTDEEITWLWDKVRNCLTKEEEKNSNKTAGVGSGDQAARTVPTLSTKIIDGASLGFGGNNGGMTGLRTGSGFFNPRAVPATVAQSNKVKPALQQQGSYLRRYGLLKQRRVHSASSLGPSVPVTATQRATSAIYGRHTSQLPGGQPQPSDNPPTPIAFAYKPQDDVSESTAAFMMAERLAKQSLTDSHIQAAMEEAQMKQDMHNHARNRGGASALSIEEQRLMESLDRLNDRLKVNDTNKTNGTIHYHQPYQPHLPGFRGHQTLTDHRRPTINSPRGQASQRAQALRIRNQTRQYR